MKSFIRLLSCSVAATLGLALHAEEPAPMAVPVATTSVPSGFTLSLGGFLLSSVKTTASLSASNGSAGTEVDFSAKLGQSTTAEVFRVDGEWRIAARHKIEFSYFEISQDGSKVIDTSINWGDQVFPVNATINSKFSNTVYKLNYGYVFYQNGDTEVTGLIGAHVTRYDAKLGLASGASTQDYGVTAPLPVIGIEWTDRIAERWTSRLSFEYFGISLDNKYSGHLTDFQGTVDYQLSRNWSLGGGYERFAFTAKMKGNYAELKVSRAYNGLLIYLKAHF
jgi:hypothetical protein